ncbi:hypothetical protein BDV96DRAFT_329989 [Lophiotrema nucula]|uniref:Uncharacterized protein n=1 Tax=Lophiotrema nucula TaxID=690887 RepID=A0A6A5YHM3_9PLEO|nr:hypothetical protein BDV96DRAFT_329989 [Lophiotrema nucula]
MPHTLMTLPRELRDKICTFAILARKNDPPELDQNFWQLIADRESYPSAPPLRTWTSPNLIRYLPSSYHASSTPLLLVNRQLCAETEQNLRILKGARTYETDVIVLDEIILVTTFLRVPVLARTIDTSYVTFRIAGNYCTDPAAYEGFPDYKGFQVAPGLGPAMAWQIYGVLERFFLVGPTGANRHLDENRSVSIKSLDINIETPPDVESWRFGPPRSSDWFALEEEDHVLDPGDLKDFVYVNIRHMLGMVAITGGFGNMFHEHLDEVVVRLDGKECKRYDVAKMFQELEFGPNAFTADRGAFEAWKAMATQKRKKSGLRVLE